MTQSSVNIENANVQVLIGVESEALSRTTKHVLTMVITANDIKPEEFEGLKRRGTVKVTVA